MELTSSYRGSDPVTLKSCYIGVTTTLADNGSADLLNVLAVLDVLGAPIYIALAARQLASAQQT